MKFLRTVYAPSFFAALFLLLALPVFASANSQSYTYATNSDCWYNYHYNTYTPTNYSYNNCDSYNYNTSYPYTYTHYYTNAYYYGSTLYCTPYSQTISLGQTVVLSALGGSSRYNSYSWRTPDQTFLSLGSTFSFTPQRVGAQNVTVSNGSQTAVCTINVTGYNYNTVSVGGYYGNYGYAPSITATYYPSLPSTGFAPQDPKLIAFALLALLILGTTLFPYVRKAFAVALR